MELKDLQPGKRICKGIVLLSICWGLTALIPAASPAGAEPAAFRQTYPAIRISTNLVTVPVSVTDPEGSTVEDLEIRDFQLREDGRAEEISKLVQAGESPLQLVLVFDLTGSIFSDFEFERTAASRFIDKVWKPGDTITIISIDKQPAVSLETSYSPEEALRVLSQLQPTENATAFYDSIVLAAELLNGATAPGTRQAAVIFSDGEDNRSDHGFKDALDAMRHSNTVVYSINPSGPSIRLNEISRIGQKCLLSLAGKTGGTAFVSNRASDLDDIYDRIAFELRAQYLLSYYSSNTHADGSYRSISVTLPEKPDLNVRARLGYYAIDVPSDMLK